jgi:uncharacterized protein
MRRNLPLTPVIALLMGLTGCTNAKGACGSRLQSSPGQYCGYDQATFSGVDYSSQYLTMRDGVRIALDLYLPHGLQPGQRLPTILEQTRYYRRLELRAPFRWLTNGSFLMPRHARLFLKHGYAWVKIDVRGTGASFGNVSYPFSPDQLEDANEVVSWIVRQRWSNGKVGATGLSYDGDAAEFLLVARNPAVKAIAPYFSFWDTYTDTAFPGGAYLRFFIHGWSHLDYMLDHAELAGFGKFKWYLPWVFKGVQPVEGAQGRELLRQAIAGHKNVDVASYLDRVIYRDDIPPELVGAVDGGLADRQFAQRTFKAGLGLIALSSPDTYRDDIEASGSAIYIYDGWYDAAYARGALTRFLTLKNPRKLILGPWIHGFSRNVANGEEFDEGRELLRFFDYWLKGIQNGVMQEAPITYYTMVADRWQSAWTWPPPGSERRTYYFGPNHSLATIPPPSAHAADTYRVDYSATTGRRSRWEPLLGDEASGGSSVLDYGDRRHEDHGLLSYESAPLRSDTEITGDLSVTLYLTSSASDGYVFAYLEDVDGSGVVHYVTEGELRAIDRKPAPATEWLPRDSVQHTFLRRDASPLKPGQVAKLTLDLLPVSYLFKAGHSIRLALAGADRDHFPIFAGAPPILTVERNATYASHLDLPVMVRSPTTN